MQMIDTGIEGFKLRFAHEGDIPLLLDFIRGLAEYEKLGGQVTATGDILRDSLFVRKAAEVVIGEFNREPACFALFFQNFSTFLGKPGIYLEDLFVKAEYRGRGFGRTILAFLAKLAVERDCGRLEWWCLDWNESSIRFYRNLGAVPMNDWTVYRMTDRALSDLAGSFGENGLPG